MKDAEAWWGELDFVWRQRHRTQGSRFVVNHCIELFLYRLERDHFYTLLPNDSVCKSNRPVGVTTPEMFCSLGVRIGVSSLRVFECLFRKLEVEMKLMTLGAFLWTVRPEVFDSSAIGDMNPIRDIGDILCCVS